MIKKTAGPLAAMLGGGLGGALLGGGGMAALNYLNPDKTKTPEERHRRMINDVVLGSLMGGAAGAGGGSLYSSLSKTPIDQTVPFGKKVLGVGKSIFDTGAALPGALIAAIHGRNFVDKDTISAARNFGDKLKVTTGISPKLTEAFDAVDAKAEFIKNWAKSKSTAPTAAEIDSGVSDAAKSHLASKMTTSLGDVSDYASLHAKDIWEATGGKLGTKFKGLSNEVNNVFRDAYRLAHGKDRFGIDEIDDVFRNKLPNAKLTGSFTKNMGEQIRDALIAEHTVGNRSRWTTSVEQVAAIANKLKKVVMSGGEDMNTVIARLKQILPEPHLAHRVAKQMVYMDGQGNQFTRALHNPYNARRAMYGAAALANVSGNYLLSRTPTQGGTSTINADINKWLTTK